MNQRIRNRGLAAREMLLRRDLVENKPKDISDAELSETQNKNRKDAHPINEQAKATFKTLPSPTPVKLGDNIFIKNDLTKLRGREQYKVVDIVKDDNNEDWIEVQKADSQLRSRRYKLKPTEVIPVPFGNNTVKEVPEIVFSQELDPLHGFSAEFSESSSTMVDTARHSKTSVPLEHLKKQRNERAKLIKQLEDEIKAGRGRGRPPKPKYPENDTLEDNSESTNKEEVSNLQTIKSKLKKESKTPPMHAFNYEEWQAMLEFQPYYRQQGNALKDNDEEDSNENSDKDIDELLDRDIDPFMESFMAYPRTVVENIDNIADPDSQPTTSEEMDDDSNSFKDNSDKEKRVETLNDTHTLDEMDDSETEDGADMLETNLKEFERSWFSSIDSDEVANTQKEDSEHKENNESIISEIEAAEDDDDEEVLELIQNRRPVKNEKILIFCKIRNSWEIVTLLTNAFPRYLSKGWFYNFKFQDGSTAGNYLPPGKPYWGLLTEEQALTMDVNSIIPQLCKNDERLGQLDGAITPDSLTPDSSANEQVAFLELEDPLTLKTNKDAPGDQYIDDNLSDQDSICGDSAEEYQIVKLIEEACGTVDDNFTQPNQVIPEPNWSMYPLLNLDDQIVKGKKYRLPEYTVHELPRSISAPDVTNMANDNSSSTSNKNRFDFLRGLFNRFLKFRNRK